MLSSLNYLRRYNSFLPIKTFFDTINIALMISWKYFSWCYPNFHQNFNIEKPELSYEELNRIWKEVTGINMDFSKNKWLYLHTFNTKDK